MGFVFPGLASLQLSPWSGGDDDGGCGGDYDDDGCECSSIP